MASRMFSNDGYFPVPTMRRDLNSLPPSHSDVSYMATSLYSFCLIYPLGSPSAATALPLTLVAVYPPPIGWTISTLSPSEPVSA